MSVQDSAAARLEMDAGSDPGVRFLRDLWWKRSLDVLAATTLLILSLPLWGVVALLIKLDSPGPVLYVQQAIGKGGRPFRFYKFRTMYANSDDAEHRHYVRAFVEGKPFSSDDESSGPVAYKITTDRRISRVGRILRKTSLDELPQLLSVLKGDMSLVGPRPPSTYEYELYDAWAKQRLSVRPGISGLYQITRRSRAPFREMVEIDLDYIRRRSLWLDLSIMLWTPAAMVLGRGAY